MKKQLAKEAGGSDAKETKKEDPDRELTKE